MGKCIQVHGLKLYTESGIRVSDDSSLDFQLDIVYASGQIDIHPAHRIQGRPFVGLDKYAFLAQIL